MVPSETGGVIVATIVVLPLGKMLIGESDIFTDDGPGETVNILMPLGAG
jgi:hypothetical protein